MRSNIPNYKKDMLKEHINSIKQRLTNTGKICSVIAFLMFAAFIYINRRDFFSYGIPVAVIIFAAALMLIFGIIFLFGKKSVSKSFCIASEILFAVALFSKLVIGKHIGNVASIICLFLFCAAFGLNFTYLISENI